MFLGVPGSVEAGAASPETIGGCGTLARREPALPPAGWKLARQVTPEPVGWTRHRVRKNAIRAPLGALMADI